MLPEDDRNRYACGSNPIHLSLMINKYKYRYPYGTDFGGNFFKYFICRDKLYVLKFWLIFIRGFQQLLGTRIWVQNFRKLFFTPKFLHFLHQSFCIFLHQSFCIFLHQRFCIFLHQSFCIFYTTVFVFFYTKVFAFFTPKFLHFFTPKFCIFYTKVFAFFLHQSYCIFTLKFPAAVRDCPSSLRLHSAENFLTNVTQKITKNWCKKLF